MKKVILVLSVFQILCMNAQTQSVGINTDGSVPDGSAILDIKSSNKGILVPRISTTQRMAIVSPATGLLVFDSDTQSFWYYTGTEWMGLSGWALSGNSSTDRNTHFLGTTDDRPLIIKTNNEISGRIETSFFGNVSWGYQALRNNAFIFNNTAIGRSALQNNTGGNSNTAIGSGALFTLQNGTLNTAVGLSSLTSLTTGFWNTAIGANADVSLGDIFNSTAIGYEAIVTASNKVRIGNTAVTVIEGQVPFTTPSDGRFKYNVHEDVKGLDFILQLRPVTYQFDTKKFDEQLHGKSTHDKFSGDGLMQASYKKASAIRRTGFIAQEVEKAAIKSGYDFSGIVKPATSEDHYSLSYESFVVPLVKAVQEQEKLIEELKRKVDMLNTDNQKKDDQYNVLLNRIEKLELNKQVQNPKE